MTPTEFRDAALAHYKAKLAEESKRWGVKAVSNGFCDHNSSVPVEHMSDMWEDLSKQLGWSFVLDYSEDDPQSVFCVISEHLPPRPEEVAHLHAIVDDLMREDDENEDRLSEDIDTLETYSGPYKMELPEDVLDSLFT